MQMDHLPSREVEAPNLIRSSFVVGVTRGFGGGGGGAEGQPSSYLPSHYHAVHLPGAGAAAPASTVTPTIPKEERDPPSPPPPPPTLPLLDSSGTAFPPPAAAAINSGSTYNKAVIALESSSYVYRECLRNHAASLGGNATDGCGEFMPGDVTDGAAPDAALICSACGCHRNFHRKELADGGSISHQYGHSPTATYYPAVQHMQYLTGTGRKVVGQKGVLISTATTCTALVPYRQAPPPQPPAPTAMAALPLHAAPAPLESDNEIDHADGGVGGHAPLGGVYQTNNVAPAPFLVTVPPGYGKKRFRTRFTPEQKKKMLAFAERIGWRLQRREEGEVQRFCQEIGVKRRVLKVWMHNNKHSRNINSGGGGGIYSATNEMIISNTSNGCGSGDVRDHHHPIDDNTVVHHDVTRSHDHQDGNTVVHHQVRSTHDHHDGRDLSQGTHHNGFAARIATTSPPPPHPQLAPLHHQHPVSSSTGAIQQVEERSQPASSSLMIS